MDGINGIKHQNMGGLLFTVVLTMVFNQHLTTFTMVLLWFYQHLPPQFMAPSCQWRQASGQPGGAPIPWPSRRPWRNPAAPFVLSLDVETRFF